ncbi:glycosyltransferase [Colidextribacter sp. OB.20]|uniref:glycosyltransferase family 2 protein n=1 Tax=Colidextribacter sp. OB.20 TaxID=2304568 RepID=UPI00136EEDD8|nr:glycosyltransferase [Colidextribacter sp. OB.20]NBI10558.1 glycosyltransferase [Colidextribacter sp. OB.20]
MKKITIVLPVYNGSRYLSASIESVIMQTYQNWELIVVDDCSSDGSLQIAEGYAQRDRRIRVILNEVNQRLPKSLNIGFGEGTGEYLTWTSDDNLYHEQAIETMAEYLDSHEQCGLVYCDMQYIDHMGKVISDNRGNDHNLFLNDCVGACFMYRKSVADAIGGYDPDQFLVEDYDYWLRIGFQYPVERVPEIMYSYRFHDGNLTAGREREIMEKVAALKTGYLEPISRRLNNHDFIVFCTGILLNKPDSSLRIERIAQERGLEFHSEEYILSRNSFDPSQKFIIFGAGVQGQRALRTLGAERVAYFADNRMSGQVIEGIQVISAEQTKEMQNIYNITVAAGYHYVAEIIEQFQELGITRFSIFHLLKTAQTSTLR